MMLFPFLRFPTRRRLRVFEVWIFRQRVDFGTKTPGEALLRKCINPLRYFHPEAAKYLGLSEGDAASAEAYAGDMKLISHHIPGAGSLDCGCPVRENHTVVFPQPPSEAKLPSSGHRSCVRNAFWRDPRFSKISNRGLAISREIGYTVCRVKRKAAVSRLLQQAIWKRSFFMCGLFFGARSPMRCNHPASLLSLILPQAISSVHSSSRSRRSRSSSWSILPSASSRSTALIRCSSVPTISKSVR